LLDEVEAAAVQLVVPGLVQAGDRWAALVEDGEDHQVVACVDGDAEDAARCAAAGVADGVGGQFGDDERGDVGFGAVGQVAGDEPASFADLGGDSREVAARGWVVV
jgi:hypothetical protein